MNLSYLTLSSKDWLFFFNEQLSKLPLFPFIWDGTKGYGLGENVVYVLWIRAYQFITTWIFHNLFHLNWFGIGVLIFFAPFFILSILSSYFLTKSWLGSLIYATNTYILMIIGGGQMGIALAYSIAPLVFAWLTKRKNPLVGGLLLSLQIIWDPRITLITIMAIFGYYLLLLKPVKFKSLIIPFLMAIGLNFFWIFPLMKVGFKNLGGVRESLTSAGMVEFLSFTDFSKSFSLLHPNWPENIFGKTSFMQPEFLLIPILAFSSLLFLKNSKAKIGKVVFFACLGLVGAFLAKGTKPPLGEVYLWLFNNLPGMNLFRDSTKFYFLTALSYSSLIPFSLEQISLRLKFFKRAKYLIFGLFILSWLFLIRPAWLGQLSGTFKIKRVPQEYVNLKDFINEQDEFFRTFWLPQRQRFGFFDYRHPAMEGSDLPSKEELAIKGVKYVVIPFDSEGEIFLEDRKYDHQQRLALEKKIDEVNWLKKLDVTDKVTVYETQNYKDHFFIEGEGAFLSWEMINPVKYSVSLETDKPVRLVFSETYDKGWQAKLGKKEIFSKENKGLNSFSIDRAGKFEVLVEYLPQRDLQRGLFISLLILAGSLFYIVWRS